MIRLQKYTYGRDFNLESGVTLQFMGSTSVASVAASCVLVAASGVVYDSSLFSLEIAVSKKLITSDGAWTKSSVSLIKQFALVGQQNEAFCLQDRVVYVAHVGQAHPCYTSRTAEYPHWGHVCHFYFAPFTQPPCSIWSLVEARPSRVCSSDELDSMELSRHALISTRFPCVTPNACSITWRYSECFGGRLNVLLNRYAILWTCHSDKRYNINAFSRGQWRYIAIRLQASFLALLS